MPKRRHPLNLDDVVALPANSKALVESDFLAAVTSMQADGRRLSSSVETGFVPGAIIRVGGIQTQISKEKLARVAELIADPRLQDVISLLNPHRVEAERVDAAQRIAKGFAKSVIYKTRWRFVRPELQRLASMHRKTEEQELEELVVARLFQIVHEYGDSVVANAPRAVGDIAVGEYLPGQLDEAFHHIQGRLNHWLTIDLLGTNWRQKYDRRPGRITEVEEVELDKNADEGLTIDRLDARLLLERLLTLAKLSKREEEIFYRAVEGELLESIALDLKIKPVTARVLYHTARQKIKKNS